MKRFFAGSSIILLSIMVLSGCVVRTYESTRDRVDQDLSSGNRGYLQGSVPANMPEKERKATRTTKIVEIELYPPIKFEKKAKCPQKSSQSEVNMEIEQTVGNRGYISGSDNTEAQILQAQTTEKYTVQKNDTLQKISQKFFGTTKKWQKIYDANKDIMKGPNKIYPGQVINIPTVGESKISGETQENLK